MNSSTLSLIERTRRAQLVEVTIGVVADHGYSGASLQRIADGAGITKAAVLYHFPSKAAVVAAAQEVVLGRLIDHVRPAVEGAAASDAPGVYIREMVGHLRRHPGETRMIIESLVHDPDARSESSARWRPVAALLGNARAALGHPAWTDEQVRAIALIVGGGIDGIVAEQFAHPGFDSANAAKILVSMIDKLVGSDRV